jgi:general secretion pathway protein G
MKKSGFTMIELVVVIMIIGLISSVMLPNFASIQDSAKNNTLKQVIHTLQMSVESYQLSTGAYPSTMSTIESLVTALQENGDLSGSPSNPFTGNTFSSDDSSGLINFVYNSSDDDYYLEGFGRNNTTSLIQVGSY